MVVLPSREEVKRDQYPGTESEILQKSDQERALRAKSEKPMEWICTSRI